jgi:hydrogenase nickel incorporation protein HypA/HybF
VDDKMHEVGIMESALGAVLGQARSHAAQRVHRIVLRIGSLSGVDVGALRFAFDVVAKDTLAAGASLEIDEVPARAHCATCDEDFGTESGFIFACPRCGSLSGDLRQGRELELSRIEMS